MKDSQKKKKTKKSKTIPTPKALIKKVNLFYIGLILFLFTSVLFIYLLYLFHQINQVYVNTNTYSEIKITSVPNFPKDNGVINASSEAYVVFDKDSRSVLAGKNQNLRFSPASTAKIMTAILSLEQYNKENYVVVPNLASVSGSSMHLFAGEEIQIENLLYGMMLPSGNDAAYTLASLNANGVDGFVAEMNKKARELQMVNTYFTDPAGFDDTNYTTAKELARLASYAMDNPTFAQIVKTREKIVYDKYGNYIHSLKNLNELLRYENVIGVKTGFTNEAGGVLVTAVVHNNKTLIVVVLKSQDRFFDTQDLMNFIEEKIQYSAI